MNKLRVYELSKELGITSKDIIQLLQDKFNITIKNHMSTIEEQHVIFIKSYINDVNYKDFTLKKLVIKNVKQFKENIFDFSNSHSINTISGGNGSGKSTIFKCLTFVQKAFFIELLKGQLNYQEQRASLGKELYSFFNGIDSCIEVEFKKQYESQLQVSSESLQEIASDSENSNATLRLIVSSISNEQVDWKLDCSSIDYKVIHKFWNLSDPRNIIIYVESYDTISEEDVKYDSINIKSEKKHYSNIVDIILNQNQIFNQLYKNLVNDYLYYRLVPPDSDGRRDIYYYVTKVLFKHLFPNIELKNFSGKTRNEQFILLASNSKRISFDIRNFSSGEKLVFYLLLFINYTRSLGILIIDEMENHLHEEIACKFLNILSEICKTDNYSDYIMAKNEELAKSSKQSDILRKNIFTAYSNFKVNQIFLLTHSKSLIYANFGLGRNFILKNQLELLDNNYERDLRTIGISYTYEKVLFVEGKTDCSILNDKMSISNIKVKKLGNCTEVIDTYKRLLNIKEFIRDSKYVFLIDKDSREIEDIEKLKALDTQFFDESFICLERHEIENYFLDPKAILKVITKYNEDIKTTIDSIYNHLYEIATENKYASKRKYLNYYLNMKLESLKTLINIRDIDKNISENEETYKNYLQTKILQSDAFLNLQESLIKIYEDCTNRYSENVWSSEWQSLCDGKIVFNIYTSKYAKTIGLTNEHFQNSIIKEVLQDKDSSFNNLVNKIITYFL